MTTFDAGSASRTTLKVSVVPDSLTAVPVLVSVIVTPATSSLVVSTDTVLLSPSNTLSDSSFLTAMVTVLADTAIRGHDLDEAKALEAKQRAEDALRNATDKQEIATLQSEFAMMAAQLAAIQKLRKH